MKFMIWLCAFVPMFGYGVDTFTLRERLDYHELSAQQVDKAFRNYQVPMINPNGERIAYELNRKPWAGYWYPINDIDSLVGKNSPLENLEKILRRFNRENYVLKYEENELTEIYADSWEGYCHAWAMASALFPEPTKSIRIKRRELSISDLKAIMIKLVEATNYDMIGIRYYGDFETDGTYQDLRPEAVHAVLTYALSRNMPVLIDDDPGTEVWTKPVFSFDYEVRKDPRNPNAVLVKAFIGVVKQRDYISDELTSSDDLTYIPLEYRLYLGINRFRGKRRVLAGEWLNNSLHAHPDLIMIPNPNATKSFNETINNNSELIKSFINLSY